MRVTRTTSPIIIFIPLGLNQLGSMALQKCISHGSLTQHLRSSPMIIFILLGHNHLGSVAFQKCTCNLLEPYIPIDFSVRDTISFVQEIDQLSTCGKFMISFDIESLL